MAKKTKLQVWTGDAFEDLFPETHISLINMDGGDNLLHKLNTIEAVAKGAQQSVVYNDYEEAIDIINNLPEDALNFGQNIYIIDVDIPDLWVSGTQDTKNKYNYVSNEELINALNTEGAIWVGHYILSQLEGGSKAVVNGLYSEVTVGGVHQNVWDADTKLDKRTGNTPYNQVYAKGSNGQQFMLNVSMDVQPSQLAQRRSDGTIFVPTNTTLSNAAISKYQADDSYLAKVTSTNGTKKAYIANAAGGQSTIDVTGSVVGNTIVQRTNTAHILVPTTPTSQNDAVNKAYVETTFVSQKEYVKEVNTMPQGSDGGVFGNAYIRDWKDVDNTVIVSSQVVSGKPSIPIRTAGGNFYVSTPTIRYEVANKGYVDDNFVPKTQFATNGIPGLVAPYKSYGAIATPNGILAADTMTLTEYNSASVSAFVGKGTLDNILANISGGGGGTKLYLHTLKIASTSNNSALNINNPTGEIKVLCTINTALTLDELLKNEVIFISGYCTDNSSFNGILGVMLTRNIVKTILYGVDYANNIWCGCAIDSITSDTITEF